MEEVTKAEYLTADEGDFGFLAVLTLSATDVRSFWHMFLAILLWMT